MPKIGMNPYYSGPKSDHFDGRRFFNPGRPPKPGFLSFLKWHLTSEWEPWPKRVTNTYSDKPPGWVDGERLRVSFVGHATTLIQTQGLNILTDPIWSERASPFQRFGPRRATDPGIAFDNLPQIDAVLITHNHYDHLDLPTLSRLWQRDRPRIIAPLGNGAIIRGHDPDIAVETFDWGEHVMLGLTVRVHLEKTHHWSARGIFDRQMALWASFVIETVDGSIYFVGDSGYGDGHHFCEAFEKHGPFRLAVLPIGAYEPRWFMAYSHMNPDEAVQAHIDLGSPPTLASHFGTFQLTNEGRDAPVEALHEARLKHDVSPGAFRALTAGEAWDVR